MHPHKSFPLGVDQNLNGQCCNLTRSGCEAFNTYFGSAQQKFVQSARYFKGNVSAFEKTVVEALQLHEFGPFDQWGTSVIFFFFFFRELHYT